MEISSKAFYTVDTA